MHRTTSIAAVITATLAVASPAWGREFCLDRNGTVYKFVSSASEAVQRAHGPPSHSLKAFFVDGAAEAMLKELAKSNFHVPTCPTNVQRTLRAMVKELEQTDRPAR